MEHKDMTYMLSSRLGGELAGRGSGLDAKADDAGDPRARAALPSDAAPTLNAAQLEAVTATEGYVRVIAGAGTGKTRALTERFAYLVNDLGIMPGNILCVTFTNKAANEMRHRIRALTGDNDTGFINTFHGFARGFARRSIPEELSRARQRRHRSDASNHLRRAGAHAA